MRYRLRTLLNWLFNKPVKFDPVELHRKMAAENQAAAEQKLGRTLSADEEYRIWNHGSFMGQEAIYSGVYHAESPAVLENYLANLPKPDPLPEPYTRR